MLKQILNTIRQPTEFVSEIRRSPGSNWMNFVRMRGAMLAASVRANGMREKDVQLGPNNVHYWDNGTVDAPVLVLIHGFGADAVWQWEGQVAALARSYRIIMPNLLWFGRSTSRDPLYTIEDQVQLVVSLLDHLKVDSAHVCGLSYGGAVAGELANLHQDRVKSLTLAAFPGHAYRKEDLEAMKRRFQTRDISNVFIPSDADDVRRLLRIGYKRPPLAPSFALRQVLDVLYGEFKHEKRRLIHHLVEEIATIESRTFTFQRPVQLLWGRDDAVFPLALAQRFVSQLGDQARLDIVEETAHAPNLERPKDFSSKLDAFCSSARLG